MKYSYSQIRAMDQYRLDLFRGVTRKGAYDIPVLDLCHDLPECVELVSFNELFSRPKKAISRCGIHFFVDDYQFMRVWNNPQKWVWILRDAKFVLTPDFSLYADMPICQQIYNVYRSRLLGVYFQRMGAKVIPTIAWSDERSYEFCFEGVEVGSVVAVSNVGCLRDPESRRLWRDGFNEMRERLRPSKILLYGEKVDVGCENIVYFCNGNLKRMRKYGRQGKQNYLGS